MKFSIGDRIYTINNNTGTVCRPINQDSPSYVAVRLDNYIYDSDVNHHWFLPSELSLIIDSKAYICPVCNKNRCSTSECG